MYRAMGIDYITHSFKTAAATDPAAKLYYNDFNIERCCNAKINATYTLVKTVQAAGARVDGIGMQGHSRVGKSPSKKELMDTMARFSELVDEVAYTEIDIRHLKLPTPLPRTKNSKPKTTLRWWGPVSIRPSVSE
ncbi:glycoside hydrolase superfamily [Bombardia bombarda]|uniref:endo-1,4-beta-xylanase n=1 Tax=Bombardia bombarda TaxID=252184 RepID=A0AA40C8Z5_9PEZI|nr:glycoside hydrolase superfamily [Bombardia bombarda]